MTTVTAWLHPRVRLPLAVLALATLLQLVFAPPIELIAPGIANGSLYGLTAVGLLLIYRNNRIVNFAAAGLGAVPGVLAALLTSGHGLPFFLALLLALGGGALLGGACDVLVVRRFSQAPRLILTVVTLGLVQALALAAIYVPIWLGSSANQSTTVSTPFDSIALTFHDRTVLRGPQLFAVLLVAFLTLGLSTGLRRTRVGVGLRAAAENPDRAALLGVPGQLIGTVAWCIAGLFAGVTIFLRATLIGIPYDGSLGYSVLLYALAAAVVARMERVGVALLAGIGIGVLEQASVARTGSPDLTSAVMLLIIVTALLVQRGSSSPAPSSSALGITGQFRPIPPELRSLPEIRGARVALAALIAGIALAAPGIVGEGGIGSLTLLPIFGMVAVSLVVLTGWAGQISLGHMALVGVGAAVAGGLAADHNVDFFVALFLGTLAGAAVALLIGLPAVRTQGLYLAVTTLSFAGAAQYWLLKKGYPVADAILPSGADPRVRRPVLWQRIDLADDRAYYGLCCVMLAVVMLMASRFRRSRSGRVFLAVRDNARGAPAYAVDVTRTRLVAFALSGAIAAAAGVLLIYQQKVFDADTYGIAPSIEIFVAAVIGGLSSLPGAVLVAMLVFGVKYFGERYVPHASLLVTGPGLLVVLYLLPGGLSQLLFGIRDRGLRRVAHRRGLQVPSLRGQRSEPLAEPAPAHADPAPETQPGTALLECRAVEVAYGGVQVLFGIDLQVKRGEIVALLGTNGAGKSTLLKAVSGLVTPIGGTIRFGGQDISRAKAVAIAKMGVVHVSGGKATFPTLTVAEHFTVGSWLLSKDDKTEIARRIEQVLSRFPQLRERWDSVGGDLSGGEQQQLALAMAFIARPTLLIIDELSLGLAPSVVAQLLEMVREIHTLGCTIIVVEQSINVALSLAQRAYFLEKGQVRFSGGAADLLDRSDLLRSVFLSGAADPRASSPATSTTSADEPKRERTREPVLEVRQLAKSFGGIQAVNDVSFTLHRNEILGLIGPNGAGKTTIFDLISGIAVPDSGQLLLEGVDVTGWAAHRRAAAGLGRSFQDAKLFPGMTVSENIALALERHLEHRDHLAAALALPAIAAMEEDIAYTVADLVDMLNLRAYRNTFVAELSAGTRRIVDLAMAIAHDPKILLLDEPSSGVAQRETEALGLMLRRIQVETGCALLVIEHDMPLLSGLCDELVALDLGSVVTRDAPHDVLGDARVINAYLGGDLAAINRSGRTPRDPVRRRATGAPR